MQQAKISHRLAEYKHEHVCLALNGSFAGKVGLGGKNQPSTLPFEDVLATATMVFFNLIGTLSSAIDLLNWILSMTLSYKCGDRKSIKLKECSL